MRKTALPLASIALALLASGVGLLHAVESAEATFAGQNGNIAYLGFDGNDYEIYTTSPAGGPPFQVTYNDMNDEAPMWGSRP
jgi:hypothetical protein